MHFDVTTLDDVKADTNETRAIYSQENIALALGFSCDTNARRDYKPRFARSDEGYHLFTRE